MTSTRRCWPLTLMVMRRSPAPGIEQVSLRVLKADFNNLSVATSLTESKYGLRRRPAITGVEKARGWDSASACDSIEHVRPITSLTLAVLFASLAGPAGAQKGVFTGPMRVFADLLERPLEPPD